MQLEIVDNIPLSVDLKEFIEQKKIRRVDEEEVQKILEIGVLLAKPKALLTFTCIKKIDGLKVYVEGEHVFESKILSDKLKVGQPIAVYVITIGDGIERKASELARESVVKAFVLEAVGDYLLGKTREYVKGIVECRLGGKISSFAPGTGRGDLFDIKQQEVIFKMMEPWKHIGVKLTENFLMVPRKSSSGVFAVSEEEYVACMYCPRKCENRRKPFIGVYGKIECNHK